MEASDAASAMSVSSGRRQPLKVVVQVKLEDDEEAERRRNNDFHKPLPESALAVQAGLRAAVEAGAAPALTPVITDVPTGTSVLSVILDRQEKSKSKRPTCFVILDRREKSKRLAGDPGQAGEVEVEVEQPKKMQPSLVDVEWSERVTLQLAQKRMREQVAHDRFLESVQLKFSKRFRLS